MRGITLKYLAKDKSLDKSENLNIVNIYLVYN